MPKKKRGRISLQLRAEEERGGISSPFQLPTVTKIWALLERFAFLLLFMLLLSLTSCFSSSTTMTWFETWVFLAGPWQLQKPRETP